MFRHSLTRAIKKKYIFFYIARLESKVKYFRRKSRKHSLLIFRRSRKICPRWKICFNSLLIIINCHLMLNPNVIWLPYSDEDYSFLLYLTLRLGIKQLRLVFYLTS
uniref:Uncharacterized protein n=1 Tax=Fusarium anthophilum TaxID=48485 RepID=A0A6M4B0U5_9HYPO|nr:hypothetical protein [Fusarium anthophilum]